MNLAATIISRSPWVAFIMLPKVNTGVGCHALLLDIYIYSGLVSKSCPTLPTPWTIACQAPMSVGFSRQEYCSGLPFPSPGDLSDPGIEPRSPALQADSCIVGRFFTNWVMTEAQRDRKVLVFQEWGEDLSWCRMNLDTWRLGWS